MPGFSMVTAGAIDRHLFFGRIFSSHQGGTGMEDTRLYAMLLGIDFPWRISKVQVDMASERIDV